MILQRVDALSRELDRLHYHYSMHVVVGDINDRNDQVIGICRVSNSSDKGLSVLAAGILYNERYFPPTKRLHDILRVVAYDDEFLSKVNQIVHK